MRNIQVAVAEYDGRLLEELEEVICDDSQLNMVGVAEDGREARRLIEENDVDVIVMELLLPYIDGFALADLIRNSDKVRKKPKIIMTTSLYNNAIVKESFNKGIDYFVVKPYDLETITNRIKKIVENDSVNVGKANFTFDVNSVIADELMKMGMPVRLKGYRYLMEGIRRATENQDVLDGITKVLYPDIAKIYDSTPQRVEKAIRHAIEVMWKKGESSRMHEYFKMNCEGRQKRPTNSEFIAVMSQHIKNLYR